MPTTPPRNLACLIMAASAFCIAGCASAGGTVRELQVQTAANRHLLAIERQRTSDLLGRRASLQAQLDRKRGALAGLQSSSTADPAAVASLQKEIAALEGEVAALTRTVSDLE